MNSIKVCEYSRSRSFHDDLILQDQASGERSQDHWSSGIRYLVPFGFASSLCINYPVERCKITVISSPEPKAHKVSL